MLMKLNKTTSVPMLISGLHQWDYPVQLSRERININIRVYLLVALNRHLLSSMSMP